MQALHNAVLLSYRLLNFSPVSTPLFFFFSENGKHLITTYERQQKILFSKGVVPPPPCCCVLASFPPSGHRGINFSRLFCTIICIDDARLLPPPFVGKSRLLFYSPGKFVPLPPSARASLPERNDLMADRAADPPSSYHAFFTIC